MRKVKVTQAEKQEFIDDFITLCERHSLTFKHYHVDYDEYDSDEGYEVVPIDTAWGYPHEFTSAL